MACACGRLPHLAHGSISAFPLHASVTLEAAPGSNGNFCPSRTVTSARLQSRGRCGSVPERPEKDSALTPTLLPVGSSRSSSFFAPSLFKRGKKTTVNKISLQRRRKRFPPPPSYPVVLRLLAGGGWAWMKKGKKEKGDSRRLNGRELHSCKRCLVPQRNDQGSRKNEGALVKFKSCVGRSVKPQQLDP